MTYWLYSSQVGDPKDAVRKAVRALIRTLWSIFPPAKTFPFVMDGLKSKNARQRIGKHIKISSLIPVLLPSPPSPLSLPECLEVIGEMIQNNGMSVCQPSPPKTLPLVAGQICDRDNGVRSAAINTMVIVYGNIGEGVYKFASQVKMRSSYLMLILLIVIREGG